jgi:peptide/nickel transport system substrate-binding protein
MKPSNLFGLITAAMLFVAACTSFVGPDGRAPSTPASSAGKPAMGGQLVLAMLRDANNLDPAAPLQDVITNTVQALVVENLYEINSQGEVVGRLVDRTENPQPNVYILHLHPGIKFHDGTDLNAEAVKFNLERQINDVKAGRHEDVKDITSIETPDATTIRITLERASAPFTSSLANNAGSILSPAAIQKLGGNLQRDLTGAGSGPYRFTIWQKDTQIVLDRNPDYWRNDADGRRLPYLDRIIFKPIPSTNVRLNNLRTGDADVILGNPPLKDVAELKKSSDFTVQEIPGTGFESIVMNTSREPFDVPGTRRALSYAIDREQIRHTVYFGTGKTLDSPVPEAIRWAFDQQHQIHLKRDVTRAK